MADDRADSADVRSMPGAAADQVKILLVEDNPGDARLLSELIRERRVSNIHMLHVERMKDALALLPTTHIDLVLLDLSLPDVSGIETVVRMHAAAPSIPIVVLTGLADEDTALDAVKRGAQDYLVKGQVDAALLTRAIRYAIERKRAEEDSRRLLREQAARLEAETAAARSRLLSDASRVLASTLEYSLSLGALAKLLAPTLADIVVVDVLEDGDELRRITAVHHDPARAELMERVREQLPRPGVLPDALVLETLRSGTSRLADCEDEAGGDSHAWSALGARATLVVPLVARDKTLGAITLARSTDGVRYTNEDVALAEEIAGRAGLALDNSRLYRAREAVIEIVSHDLRNPLNVISLSLGSLRRDTVTPQQRATIVEKLERSVRQMNSLIEDLLDMTRIDAGKMVVTVTAQDAAALVNDAIDSLRPLADEKKIDVCADVAEGLAPAMADRDRALQVFSNLVGNAIKFTPAGGRVTIGVEPAGNEVCFRVADTGPGIGAKDLPRVFDRFWQGRDRRKGAGLGLAIARGIVTAHGGRIWVESAVGQGTTFFFTLPAEHAQPAQRRSRTTPLPALGG
jgi:signal transduction histidine kinase/CheY-like chemotaxis protein